MQRVVHDLDRLVGAAGAVGVLDAQDERAAVVAREQVVVERGARVADVQRPGRGRRDPDADGPSPLTRSPPCSPGADPLDLDLDRRRPASGPTPAGVPVRITSPGNSVITALT